MGRTRGGCEEKNKLAGGSRVRGGCSELGLLGLEMSIFLEGAEKPTVGAEEGVPGGLPGGRVVSGYC